MIPIYPFFYTIQELPARQKQVLLAKDKLVPAGKTEPLRVRSFTLSEDEQQVLLFTNTIKVWRYHTRGDYWVYNLRNGTLQQAGTKRSDATLMFAKFSPDGTKVAYASANNIYTESLATKEVKQLTREGTRKGINGPFDWAYEEECSLRDGFRRSPDSKRIAFWQLDAPDVKDYLLINHTDSIYPHVTPLEYPVAVESPSPYKIGVVEAATATLNWLPIPDNPSQTNLTRMEWAGNADQKEKENTSLPFSPII